MSQHFAVAAPGKAMLIGEYAVLEGEPAVVAAVSVYARAVLGSGAPSSPFIEAAMRETQVELAELGRTLSGEPVPHVDTSAFSHGGRKLGVGFLEDGGHDVREHLKKWVLFQTLSDSLVSLFEDDIRDLLAERRAGHAA